MQTATKALPARETMSPKLRRALALLGIGVSVLTLFNPGAGILELIPDNLPFVGNLDEAGAALLLMKCLSMLKANSVPNT